MKASNVMISAGGKVTLIDLGFAKKIGNERTYSFCGTTHSMAPEFFSQDL
jgi:serine/threonine protein kinase